MTGTDVLKVIPTIQAASLVEHNVNYLKKKKKKSLVNLGIDNLIGTSLIKAESDFLNGV